MSEAQPSTRPRSTPVVCAPWCRDGDGHTRESFEDDQRCNSAHVSVPMTLRRPWTDDGERFTPYEVDVFTEAGRRYRPQIVVHEWADDVEWRFTAHEARALATVLVAAADNLDSA